MRRVGPFDEYDLAFIHSPDSLKYVKKIEKANNHIGKTDLRSKFSAIEDAGLVDLLVDLLSFNPGFRPTATTCLQHDMFALLR